MGSLDRRIEGEEEELRQLLEEFEALEERIKLLQEKRWDTELDPNHNGSRRSFYMLWMKTAVSNALHYTKSALEASTVQEEYWFAKTKHRGQDV